MVEFQARWTSRQQAAQMRKSGKARQGLLLDSFKGYIMVEPKECRLGDGALLTPAELEAELRPEWCQEPRQRVLEARRKLGLAAGAT